MRTVYLETTIVSYYVARPNRDLVIAARQQLTREWWERNRAGLRVCISPLVTEEARQGDPDAAAKRLDVLRDIEVLEPLPEIERMGQRLKDALRIPDNKQADAFHLAYAVHYRLDFLLTWNCAHLANAETERILTDYARANDLWLPIVCTLEEMAEERDLL
jgi:predicted nucleic acid-binding protein